jgi:hypothetical protein
MPLPSERHPCLSGSVSGGGDVIAAKRKEVGDLVMDGEEPPRLAGGLEPLHLAFASDRLMRLLRSVVEASMLMVLDAGHQLLRPG